MPYKGGVQLLHETQRRPTLASYTSGNGYFYAGVVIGIVVIVVGAILGSYKANLNDQIAKLDGQLKLSEDSRNKDQEKQLMDLAKQSRIAKSMLASKIYWSQAFGYLEKMIQPEVQLKTLEADVAKGTITFQASTPTFSSVARQIAAFTDGTGISDVAVDSVKATPKGDVEFTGHLIIDQKTLLNKTGN
jgi:cell division protein FtsL